MSLCCLGACTQLASSPGVAGQQVGPQRECICSRKGRAPHGTMSGAQVAFLTSVGQHEPPVPLQPGVGRASSPCHCGVAHSGTRGGPSCARKREMWPCTPWSVTWVEGRCKLEAEPIKEILSYTVQKLGVPFSLSFHPLPWKRRFQLQGPLARLHRCFVSLQNGTKVFSLVLPPDLSAATVL